MAAKLILGLIVILQIQKGISQGAGMAPDCPDFKCSSENSTLIEVYGYRLKCQEGMECNRWNMPKCEPCVWMDKCGTKFQCDSKNSVNLGGHVFSCLEDEVCNEGFEYPCDPCIPRKCSPPLHTCHAHNKTLATIASIGITITCPSGHKCNSNNALPCTPCIRDDLS